MLADLRAYALANGLPNLARKTIEAENAAKTDISEESGAGEGVGFVRVHPNKSNRNIPCLCRSWIGFNLNQIEDNPL